MVAAAVEVAVAAAEIRGNGEVIPVEYHHWWR